MTFPEISAVALTIKNLLLQANMTIAGRSPFVYKAFAEQIHSTALTILLVLILFYAVINIFGILHNLRARIASMIPVIIVAVAFLAVSSPDFVEWVYFQGSSTLSNLVAQNIGEKVDVAAEFITIKCLSNGMIVDPTQVFKDLIGSLPHLFIKGMAIALTFIFALFGAGGPAFVLLILLPSVMLLAIGAMAVIMMIMFQLSIVLMPLGTLLMIIPPTRGVGGYLFGAGVGGLIIYLLASPFVCTLEKAWSDYATKDLLQIELENIPGFLQPSADIINKFLALIQAWFPFINPQASAIILFDITGIPATFIALVAYGFLMYIFVTLSMSVANWATSTFERYSRWAIE